MKIIREALGIISALVGVLILFFGGLMPLINPLFDQHAGKIDGFGMHNAGAILVGLTLICFGYFLSKKT